MARDIRVLLAHPERNPTFQQDPGRLKDLVARGVLVQVTASSLVAASSKSRSQRLAQALVKEQVAHVIASDSHGAHISRAPLSAGVDAINQLAAGRGEWMATHAPRAILDGEPLPPPPQRPQRPRGLFRRG